MEIENKNNIEVVSDFEYFFTWADFTNILNNNTVPCDFLKEDGEYVNVGEIIFRLDLIEHFAEIAGYIDITKEGHIIFRNRIRLSSESEGKLLYAIRKNDNDRIARKFINVPEIKKDEFSGNKTIRWRTIGGHTSEKICSYSYENGIYFLDFGFNFIDNKDYIVFHSNPKQLTLSKDDTISFLLENKEIIEFKLVSNSYKVGEKYRYFPSEGYEKVLENKLVISDAELLAFETHKLIQWKIKIKKDNREINGGQPGKVGYSTEPQRQLSTIVKKLAKEYRELVRREIENYKPLLSKSGEGQSIKQAAEECYVYLMIDYTNNFHKIGISNNPEYREQTLLSQKPTIELIASKKFITTKIAASFEKALHTAYADKRVRGEWFQLNEVELYEIRFTLEN